MEYVILLLIAFSWACASFMDAVCFEKVYGENLYEVWHIAKMFAYGSIYAALWWLIDASIWWYLLTIPWCYIQHETLYRQFREWDVYKLDNSIRFPWLEKLWGRLWPGNW